MPVERIRATAQILSQAGAAVDLLISSPAPHQIHPHEVAALRALARSVASGRLAAR